MKNMESFSSSEGLALGSLERYSDGINIEKLEPKPFDLELKPVLSPQEEKHLESMTSADEGADRLLKANQERVLENQRAIEQFDEHVLEIAEMPQEERDALYDDWRTSESDKSVIACIETFRAISKATGDNYSPEREVLSNNVQKSVSPLYSFRVIEARNVLEKKGSKFRILTKKEREATASGSLEDIASAALESFLMNPDYSDFRIAEYDDYLYGMMLDCTERRVVPNDGENSIEEHVNLREFQERVIESMSGAVLNDDEWTKEYNGAEIDDIQKRTAQMFGDYWTGHHFRTDMEEWGDTRISGVNDKEKVNIYQFEQSNFWADFEHRIQSNNREVFKYDARVAKAEMRPWAKKVNLDRIEGINSNESLSYEVKCEEIAKLVQEAFEVKNLDGDGKEKPIEVKWFYYGDSFLDKIVNKMLGKEVDEKKGPEEVKERSLKGYYSGHERSIYLPKQDASRTRLSPFEIGVIAHEMWHAKQHELSGNTLGLETVSSSDAKIRMYEKNEIAYVNSGTRYRMQLLERESFAIGEMVESLLNRRQARRRGELILRTMSDWIKSIL